MKNLLISLSALLVLLVSGCATPSPTGGIKESKNHISTPNYSITVPSSRGWKEKKNINNPDLSYLEKTIGSNVYIMRFSTNMVVNENMKSWTAKQVADNYRKGEQSNMMVRGVMSGQYQLKDVIMGEEKVGNKKFFTMGYTTISRGIKQRAFLCLYFPKKTNFGRFLVSLYSEAFPVNKPPSQSIKSEFLETLKSLEMR